MEAFGARESPAEPERTRSEIIIKTVALHIAVIAAAGHLLSLQGGFHQRSKKSLKQLAWFIAVPTYPIAVALGRVVQCASIFHQQGYHSIGLRYCLGGILGSHAVIKSELYQDSFNSVCLLEVHPEDVRRTTQKRSWIWFGRLLLLMAGITQSAATFVLSCRRFNKGAMSETDIRNGFAALGGLVVMFNSVFILLLDDQWIRQPGFRPRAPLIQQSGDPPSSHWPARVHRALVTLSLLTSTWYLRFHIKDTYMVARQMERPSFCTTYCTGAVTYVRPEEGGQARLSNFLWITWPIMLYNLQSRSEMTALAISAFLSIGFPIEEIALRIFNTWKDPLAEQLYLF